MKIKQQFIAYMLSATVFFTLGMDFETNHNMLFTETPSHSLKIEDSEVKTTNDPSISIAQFSFEEQKRIAIQASTRQEMNVQGYQNEIVASMVIDTTNYEVTSHYLNVRANRSARSKILHVVKNGDVLEVLGKADNDWLKLKNGGYVHSKYTELINESLGQIKKSPKVTVLSANQPIAQENIVQVSQSLPSQPSSTVKSDSRLTEEHITQIFEGTSLADHDLEKTILDIEELYGINAYFTIAVMKLESGHGKSKIARDKNNLFGLNAIDGDAYNKAFSFETKGDSVEKFGQLISDNYIDKGFTSIEKVASKYCSANPKWSSLVMNIMKRDYKKLL